MIVLSVDPLCRVCVVPFRFRHRDHFWRRRPSFRCSLLIQILMHAYFFCLLFLSAFTSLSHFKRNGDRICACRLPQHTGPPRVGTVRSHHLFLLHISLIDPLLTELSPKTTDDGLPTGLCWAVHCLPLAVPHGPRSCEHSA